MLGIFFAGGSNRLTPPPKLFFKDWCFKQLKDWRFALLFKGDNGLAPLDQKKVFGAYF